MERSFCNNVDVDDDNLDFLQVGVGGVLIVPMLLLAGVEPHEAVYIAQASFAPQCLLSFMVHRRNLPHREVLTLTLILITLMITLITPMITLTLITITLVRLSCSAGVLCLLL